MRSPLARAAIALAAIAAVVVLFVVLAGDDDGGGNGAEQATTTTQTQPTTAATGATGATGAEKPPEPAEPVPRIVVRNGKPRGGIQELSFKSGERVVFSVQSDVADEVHVHGYDISEQVAPGAIVRFSFPARLEGVFEVELEQRKEQIAELRVNP